MTVRVVRERIDPRLTASLFANYRSAIDAIMELVDNAIDSRIAVSLSLAGRRRRTGPAGRAVKGAWARG